MVRGPSGHRIIGIVAVKSGGAFQLDVRLWLTNGIKELCCGAQNRTEKVSQREREKEKKKMTQTWEASFWSSLKRPLTQTREYDPHILCRTFFFPFLFTNASFGLQPWKMSSVLFLELLGPYVTWVEKEKKKPGDFIYLTTCGHLGGWLKKINKLKNISLHVCMETVNESEWRKERNTQRERRMWEAYKTKRSQHALSWAVMGVVWSWLALSGAFVQIHFLLPSLSPQNTFLSQEENPFLLQLELQFKIKWPPQVI